MNLLLRGKAISDGPLVGLQRTMFNKPGILPEADGDQGMVSGYEVLLLNRFIRLDTNHRQGAIWEAKFVSWQSLKV